MISFKRAEEIAETYYDDIYRFCFSRIHNEEDASDVTQDVFLLFQEKYDGLNDEKIRAWLFSVANNKIKEKSRETAERERRLIFGNIYSLKSEDEPTYELECDGILTDEEIEKIVDFIKEQENAEYDDEIMDEIERNAAADKKKGGSSGGGSIVEDSDGEYDDMLDDAVNVITELNSASTTVLQRKLRVGYARAARIMDELEQLGYVSAAEGNKPRKVLVSRSQYLEMKAGSDTVSDDFDILSD